MNSKRMKIIIVEDKETDLRDIFRYVTDAKVCDPKEDVKWATTYDDARRRIDELATETDLVLLDLSIPLQHPEDVAHIENGMQVLKYVHEVNQRKHLSIRVLIVSAQALFDDFNKVPLMTSYPDTLLGFVDKAELAQSLRPRLEQLELDPIRARIVKGQLAVANEYDAIVNPTTPILVRLASARTLAIRLLRNDLDYYEKNAKASDAYADDLIGLLRKLKADRFPAGQKYIAASAITSPGGWQAFLWRGCLEQHLYTLLHYRNDYEHIKQKPFRSPSGKPDAWTIPNEVLESLEKGELLGKAIEFIVRDLLLWYLPWHEQVYMPWKNSIAAGRKP